jgi:hypothetical protein
VNWILYTQLAVTILFFFNFPCTMPPSCPFSLSLSSLIPAQLYQQSLEQQSTTKNHPPISKRKDEAPTRASEREGERERERSQYLGTYILPTTGFVASVGRSVGSVRLSVSEREGGRGGYTNLPLALLLWLSPLPLSLAGWLVKGREGALGSGREESGGDGGGGTEAQAQVAAGWRVVRRALTPLLVLMMLWSIRR